MKITQYFSVCLSVIDFGVSADSSLTKNVPKPFLKKELRGSGNDRRALSPDCQVSVDDWIGDGYCDKDGGYNTEECGWDGGDCCEATCTETNYLCSFNGFECIDPMHTPCNISEGETWCETLQICHKKWITQCPASCSTSSDCKTTTGGCSGFACKCVPIGKNQIWNSDDQCPPSGLGVPCACAGCSGEPCAGITATCRPEGYCGLEVIHLPYTYTYSYPNGKPPGCCGGYYDDPNLDILNSNNGEVPNYISTTNSIEWDANTHDYGPVLDLGSPQIVTEIRVSYIVAPSWGKYAPKSLVIKGSLERGSNSTPWVFTKTWTIGFPTSQGGHTVVVPILDWDAVQYIELSEVSPSAGHSVVSRITVHRH